MLSKNVNSRKLITVLCVILALGVLTLCGAVAYNMIFGRATDTDSLPNKMERAFASYFTANAEETSAEISLYQNNAEDSVPFAATNMLPGDSVTKNYNIKISHKGKITVKMNIDVTAGEKLSEVLYCKVTLGDDVLWQGLMADFPKSVDHVVNTTEKTTTHLEYNITAYLDTSVGNEYMEQELLADFCWWVEEEKALEPELGGGFHIIFWYFTAFVSLFMLILIPILKRRDKKEAENGTAE